MFAEEIYENVLEAMQAAEEMGGPERLSYIELMSMIAIEAITRIGVAASQMEVSSNAS